MRLMPRARKLVMQLILISGVVAVIYQAGAQQAALNGNVISLPVVTLADQAFQVELTIQDGSNPLEVLVTSASELTDADTTGTSSFNGELLSIPSLEEAGISYWADFRLLSADPLRLVLADVGEQEATVIPQNCTRPEPDLSNGADDPSVSNGFLVPPSEIFDGGPGPDGIPAINSPLFIQQFSLTGIQLADLVIGVKIGDDVRAYPHRFLDYHEIVNDRYTFDGKSQDVTVSYCPLTGSAVLWKGFTDSVDTSFGVLGLLHNSNLILYDRETQSLWSQMLEQSISGEQVTRIPDKLQLVETSWETWLEMYPQTLLLNIELNEFSFPYEIYPYGLYLTDSSLIYPVNNSDDNRLHRKERMLGINVGEASKVYPVSSFNQTVSVLNDSVGNMDVVAAGSAQQNYAVVYNRQLEDCTTLDFSPVENQLPIVMVDNEGSKWDLFGMAVTGPRTGTQLQKTNSFIAYWFAWTAFFPGAEIHQ